MTIHVDQNYINEQASALVQINSVNPTLVPGAAGEREIAGYLAEAMAALGLEVHSHEPAPGRVSVVGRLPGSGGGRSLMLNAHVDTVGVEGMADPFSGEIANGRLYGRGAYDMKGSMAAQLGAVKALQDAGLTLAGDLLVVGVADEEYASLGTQDLLRHYTPDGAIVTEPTALRVCLAHKGFAWFEVETVGRAAHGSRPDLGVDANLRMGRVLAGLAELDAALVARPPHPLVGRPSLHAATLAGGSGLSTYAARCLLGIERRTVPGETGDEAAAEIARIVDGLADADPDFEARWRTLLVREPFEVAPDTPVVTAVTAATAAVLGREEPPIGDGPWMDSALLAAAGVETVVIGPAGAGAHAAEEWVDLDSLGALAAILAESARRYCR